MKKASKRPPHFAPPSHPPPHKATEGHGMATCPTASFRRAEEHGKASRDKRENIVLGLDPGTSTIGYGLVEKDGAFLKAMEFGCITTPPRTPAELRLPMIYREVKKILKKHMPGLVAIESLFAAKNEKTVMEVSQSRGVLLLAAGEAGIPVVVFIPPAIKLAVTGYGRADKSQVQRMVAQILKLAVIPKPDDAADALAVAICAINTGRVLRDKY